MKKGYEKLQNFVLSQNKRRYSEWTRSIEDQALLLSLDWLPLATVTAHMLAIIGKHFTCNTGRGKDKRKGGGGTHYRFVSGRGNGEMGSRSKRTQLSFFQFMGDWMYMYVSSYSTVYVRLPDCLKMCTKLYSKISNP